MISSPLFMRRRRAATAARSDAAQRNFRYQANMAQTIYDDLKQLGEHVSPPESPTAAVLERVRNPQPGEMYLVRFTCPEFTSLCPITGQPDFAHLVIDYVPADWLVESKSLKLYLGAFRNQGGFHEATTVEIARRLVSELSPTWLRIGG